MRVDHQVAQSVQNKEATQEASELAKTQESKAVESGREMPREAGHVLGSESAQISPGAREFLEAKGVAESAPDVREAKIAELRRRIENKEYNVKPEMIAERMVNEHLGTFGLD